MYDITVIGAGRVGLPLALMLEKGGHKVAVKDTDKKIASSVLKGEMPFNEPGFEKLIAKTEIYPYILEMPQSKAYIITVGTPLSQHIETDLDQIKKVINELMEKIDLKEKLIILRSTVAPHTTKFIEEYIAKKTGYVLGKDFYLSMCPERIAEGLAFKELTELPQIIGAEDEKSFELSKNIFSKIISEEKITRGTFLEAELAKLFTNIYRYINFAIPNYFAILAQSFGVDVFHLFDVMNNGYERNKGLKKPGFTAGTCLRKDFGMINEHYSQTDLILQAYKINEFMPKFLSDLVKGEFREKSVGILGYTFKADVDDVRDTLAAKLIRYIERNVPDGIKISDYNLPKGIFFDKCNDLSFDNISTSDLINSSDLIFIATNHEKYYKINPADFAGKTVVDLWRVLGKKLINHF
jgi:UDP-N-acetyl-D-mannosaminuronic acid dehydrogenase